MAQKKGPPRPFHKPLTRKHYNRKLRNRIYLDTDRAFLDSITTTGDDGMVVLSRDLSDDEHARLRKLTKEARKNRGAVRRGRLVFLAVIVGAAVLFMVFVKNRLVERGAESFLESVFDARADLTGVVFRPIRGEVAFQSIEVANARDPMTNLFSVGPGRFDIATGLLLSGKTLIRDLTVTDLAFGAVRDASGALPLSESVDTREPLSFSALGLPDTLDARAFVRRELDSLKTPEEVASLITASSDYVEQWSAEIERLTAAGAATAQTLRELAATDFTAINSVDAAIRLLEQSNSVVESTTAYANRVESAVRKADTEARELAARAAVVPAIVESDYARVLDRIPRTQAEGREFLVGLVEPYLRQRLGVWYDRILLGYSYLERLRDDVSAGERSPRRVGRRLGFGVASYPAFEIQEAFFSTSGSHERELVIQAISSDPDYTGRPTTISYTDATPQSSLSIGAVVDRRTEAAAPLSLSVAGTGAAVAVDRGLESLDLRSFRATTNFDVTFLMSRGGSVSGDLAITARDPSLIGTPNPASIGELVQEVVGSAEALRASFSYEVDTDRGLRLTNGSTNLDDAFRGLVQDRVDTTLEAFETRVRSELEQHLNPQLDRLQAALGEVVDVEGAGHDLLSLATDRHAAAVALQDRAARTADSLRSAMEEEARRRLDEAKQEAQEAAEDAADQARQDAEDAVREQVEDVRGRIRLPGF